MQSPCLSGLLLAVSLVAGLDGSLSARPVLQPEVKEYVPLGGSFAPKELPVRHQDQKQCRIAADEIPSAGVRSVFTATDDVAVAGVSIAVIDSPAGRRLAEAFSLDVPDRPQGYALSAKDGRVAIVGRDPFGTLYGAETYRQMAAEGLVENATVRDWPDILTRGALSVGRGLWFLGNGESAAGRLEMMKSGFDEMARHKLNAVTDIYRISVNVGEEDAAFWHELLTYATDRGIWIDEYIYTALWYRCNKPKDVTMATWPCVKCAPGWDDLYYCWADDRETEAAANRFADYLIRIGAAGRALAVLHPVDSGSWQDPELWSHRCAKCRARWNDHERWKASVNQLTIWSRVLRSRIPGVRIASPVYPYTFSALAAPESVRTPLWKESMPEYWRKLSEGLEDKDLMFSTWICDRETIADIRKILPDRPFHYSDSYPTGAGVFQTYSRKVSSIFEPKTDNVFESHGIDIRLRWESAFLTAEHTWNLDAPGSDPYRRLTPYYNPETDHTGPPEVMTNTLSRICRTFWGRELAPAMRAFFASGVLPLYIARPAETMNEWNSSRRDPLYDPAVRKTAILDTRLSKIVDDVKFMHGQVQAATRACAALREAEPLIGAVDRAKRKYYMFFAKNAPYWLAAAQAQYAMRVGNELLDAGRNEEAAKVLKRAIVRTKADFTAADENAKRLKDEPDTTDDGYDFVYRMMRGSDRYQKMIERVIASANVTIRPRPVGKTVRAGIVRGGSADSVKAWLDDFANVKAEIIDSVSLAELEPYDCVFVTAGEAYDKRELFRNLNHYVTKGGRGVFVESYVCGGNARFGSRALFPDVVARAPARKDDFSRKVKRADGTETHQMYIDYYVLEPGAQGEPIAFSAKDEIIAVRGKTGLGRVVACGIFNSETDRGTYSTLTRKLHGINAEIVTAAIEYLTGTRPVSKDEIADRASDPTAARPVPAAKEGEIVWSGTQTVAEPTAIDGKALRILPGTKVVFTGNGSLHIRYGDLIADGASLSADGSIDGHFRIFVEHGRIFLRACRIAGFETVKPMGDQPWVIGSIYGLEACGSRVEGCTFEKSAAVGFVVSDTVTVRDNRFSGGSSGVFLFRCENCRVTRNDFQSVIEPIRLNSVRRSMVEKNEGVKK